MNKRLNFGRSRHYVNGAQPLTKIGTRDLSKLKIRKTFKCTDGGASKEEVEKLQDQLKKKEEDMQSMLIDFATQLNKFTTQLDKLQQDNADATRLNAVNPLGQLGTALRRGNRLTKTGATIPIKQGKRIKFVSATRALGAWGNPITDLFVRQRPIFDTQGRTDEDTVFCIGLDTPAYPSVKFTFNQSTGEINKIFCCYLEVSGVGSSMPTNLDAQQTNQAYNQMEAWMDLPVGGNPKALGSSDPEHSIITRGIAGTSINDGWGLSNLNYEYVDDN